MEAFNQRPETMSAMFECKLMPLAKLRAVIEKKKPALYFRLKCDKSFWIPLSLLMAFAYDVSAVIKKVLDK